MSYYLKEQFIDLGEVAAYVNSVTVQEIKGLVEDITNEDDISVQPLKKGKNRGYVPWGSDNKFPYHLLKAVKGSVVISQNKHFNSLTCYGSGLTCKHREKQGELSEEVQDFLKYNRIPKYFMEQCMDMKNFLFSVSVIILNNEGSKIVKIVHKEAVNCRFETCDPKTGKIEYVFVKNWEDDSDKSEPEAIPILDYDDPIGELEYIFGKKPGKDGKKRSPQEIKREARRKFAIVNKFPTAGEKYYPFHPSWAVFHSKWYEYSCLIPIKKLAKLNNVSIKYLVEIHNEYYERLFKEEGITDSQKKKERVEKLRDDIKNFLTGVENSGKMWVSGYYVDPHTKTPISYIKITTVDTAKEGGELIEDSAEANNYLCYADSVHPALIGANPGKTQGSHSGSVQRELFTMKQALEKPYHDILLDPFYIIKEFNNWNDVMFDVPVITLTTLDKGKDAEENTLREPQND